MTGFDLVPKDIHDAYEKAKILANSNFVPKQYRNQPEDIVVAVQMGLELGLKPIQSLKNIAVINGTPAIYGDSMLAIVMQNPEFEDIQEETNDNAAVCRVKRKNQSWSEYHFTKEDAIKAGLWNRQGPWKQYPKRMLQMRARSFALRDKFPDALLGLVTYEEALDTPNEETMKDIKTEEVNVTTNQSRTEELTDVVQSQLNQNDLVHKVYDLLEEKQIDNDKQDAWLEKAGVTAFSELPYERLLKLKENLEQDKV